MLYPYRLPGVPIEPEARRTRYAIRMHATGLYCAHNRHFTSEPAHAIAFDTMTRATLAAIEAFDLHPSDYTVEAI